MAKSRMARVGARRPCSEWGRDIDSIDGNDVDGIMKAVPGWDCLFYPATGFLPGPLLQSGHPARKTVATQLWHSMKGSPVATQQPEGRTAVHSD